MLLLLDDELPLFDGVIFPEEFLFVDEELELPRLMLLLFVLEELLFELLRLVVPVVLEPLRGLL